MRKPGRMMHTVSESLVQGTIVEKYFLRKLPIRVAIWTIIQTYRTRIVHARALLALLIWLFVWQFHQYTVVVNVSTEKVTWACIERANAKRVTMMMAVPTQGGARTLVYDKRWVCDILVWKEWHFYNTCRKCTNTVYHLASWRFGNVLDHYNLENKVTEKVQHHIWID